MVRVGCVAATLLMLVNPVRGELIHRYSFDKDSKDSVGKIDATLKGGAKVDDGKLMLDNGPKQSDDASLSYLEFTESPLPKEGSVSLVVWITAKQNANFARVIDFGDSDAGEGRAFIYLVARHEDDKSRASITASDTGSKTYLTNHPLDDEKPHMAAIVIDGAAKKLHYYVDGKEIDSAEDLGDNTLDKVSHAHAWLGRSGFDADPGLSASIDEFRVYDHALKPEEITAVNQAGPDKLPPAGTPTTRP